MFRPYKYIPCLRWKQGEYQALSHLTSSAHDSIIPLIEVSEFGTHTEFDFETQKQPKTIDDHLSKFATRVKIKWGITECFIDMCYISPWEQMTDGKNPGEFIFDDLRAKGILAIPVLRLQEDPRYENVIKEVVKTDERGLCLRVSIEEFAKDDFELTAEHTLQHYGLVYGECDLIVDLITPNFDPVDIFSILLTNIIKGKANLDRWHSFGMISSSFPKTTSALKLGKNSVPRYEWRLYKLLVKSLQQEGARVPIFGDYVINHPDVLTLDPRIVKPNATIRYTIGDRWLVTKGLNVRDHKFGQFRQLSQLIMDSEYYCGQQYSYGDDYIFKCAHGTAKTGNLSTWRTVGTNHHIEMVVRDVAKLDAS